MAQVTLRFRVRRRGCLLNAAQVDPEAFVDFYDAYASRVLRYVRRRVLNAEVALDLVAETFTLALERRDQFRGRTVEQEQAWLFMIARNELNRYWRNGKVERAAMLRLAVSSPRVSEDDFARIDELADLARLAPMLQEALRELPEAQRRAVELRVLSEFDYPDIARELDVSEQVARARVSRGLRALADSVVDDETSLSGVG